MTFKKTEKEIIKAIVKYGEKEHSMAKVLNKSKLLENRGLVIAFASGRSYVFCDKQKYEWEDAKAPRHPSSQTNVWSNKSVGLWIKYLFDSIKTTR